MDSTAQLERVAFATIDASDNPARCHKTHMIGGVRSLLADLGSGRGPAAGVTAGTCGNFGLALALAAQDAGCPAVICIPASYGGAQVDAIGATGAVVVRHGETYEDAVAHSSVLAARDGLLDCNPGGPCDQLLLDGLAGYLRDRLVQLPERPDQLWLPLGNGSTTVAALAALRELGWACQVNAVSSNGNNSVLSSWASGAHAPMSPHHLNETSTNEPLCNWLALHGDLLFAVAGGQVSVHGVSDDELDAAVDHLADAPTGYRSARYTPAGVAGVAGFLRAGRLDDRNAVLLTARV